MNIDEAKSILRSKRIRISDSRLQLLSFFLKNPDGQELSYIQRSLSDLDRITLYRTLNTFVEKGLITQMRGTKGKAYYVFHHSKSKLHPHLKCIRCNSIQCLPELPGEYLEKLAKFQIKEFPLLFIGTCTGCQPNQ